MFLSSLFRVMTLTVLAVLLVTPSAFSQDQLPPVQWSDVADWKYISPGSPAISDNGEWFAYWSRPNKGDGELVLQHLTEDIEKVWPVGEVSGNPNTSIVFNASGTHLAFVKFPTEDQKERASRDNQPRNTLVLVDLVSFDEVTFENLRSFSFGGKQHPGWLAIQLATPQRDRGNEAGSGTDMLLYDIEHAATYNIGNVSMYAFNESGDWLAYVVDAHGQAGNGIFFRDMNKGTTIAAETDKTSYRSMRWHSDVDGLTALKEVEHEDWEDDLFHIVAFRNFDGVPEKIVYDPLDDPAFPEGMAISPNRAPAWSEDLSMLQFGIHPAEMKEVEAERDTTETRGRGEGRGGSQNDDDLPEVVIWHWKDARLQSIQQQRERGDQNINFLSLYHVDDHQFVQLADEDIRTVMIYPEGKYAIGHDVTPYEFESGLTGVGRRDLYKIDIYTGERQMILEDWQTAGGTPPSPDGNLMLFYQEGHYHVYDLTTDEVTNLTIDLPTSFINQLSDINVDYPPTPSWGWTNDSRYVLLRDNHDVWKVRYDGSEAENITVYGAANDWVYQFRMSLDPDERGIDLSEPMYMRLMDNQTKRAGIARLTQGDAAPEILLFDDAVFSNISRAKDAEVYFFMRQTPQKAPNVFVSFRDDLSHARQITDVYPEQDAFAWSAGQKLLTFVSDKGDTLQAALYLPAGYEEGESYPTVVYIYERLTQGLNAYSRPSFPGGGYNRTMYTSNGYAVLAPDIAYQLNDPGMSAVWCVLPALDVAIETGIVDPDNVAIHGHSWGGYQTSFLITQTNRFKAAVAGAPLTNMISMYSLIYWNTGSTNQTIFETSQGRLTTGYWDNMDAYQRNSPVYFAQHVETPLLLMHNDKDGAVDFTQGVEYYNTLRRLEKPVIMLQYVGENHGLRQRPNQIDYATRMMEFIDHYLKRVEAPEWLEKGVPHLEKEAHLKARPSVLNSQQ